MPFQSLNQMGSAFGGYLGPEMKKKAPKWAKKTRNIKKLPKRVKKGDMKIPGPGYDNQVGEIFVVQRPVSHDMDCQSLVHRVDPVQGIQSMGVDPSAIHGAYPDEDQAMQVAEKLQKEFTDAAIMLEKKKQHTIDRIKEAIDSLEAMRSESVNMIKENPKDSQQHKDKIAHLATKIDDLMQKLERIEGAKKEIVHDKEDKKKDSKDKKEDKPKKK